jgi:hypothetical protein
MSSPKLRHAALGLAAAGMLGAGLLAAVGHGLSGAQRLEAAEPAAPDASPRAGQSDNDARADAPATVNVDRGQGRVTVRAPHADVDVDPDKGHVKVRAPYVNLDIRW